jgi:hypothetical protein
MRAYFADASLALSRAFGMASYKMADKPPEVTLTFDDYQGYVDFIWQLQREMEPLRLRAENQSLNWEEFTLTGIKYKLRVKEQNARPNDKP